MAENPHPPQITHTCSQAETIDKINLLLFGNGHPEDGIVFKVLRMSDSNEVMKNDIGEIKTSINKLTEMHDATFKAATTAAVAIERYKAETEKFEAGKNVIQANRNQTASRWLQASAVVIAAIMMFFGYANLKRNNADMDKKITVMEKELSPSKTYDSIYKDTLTVK